MNEPKVFPPQKHNAQQRALIEQVFGLSDAEIEALTARKKAAARARSIEEYVSTGAMTQEDANLLRDAIARRASILVTGRTGAGKSWLQQAILNALPEFFPEETIDLVQASQELCCSHDLHRIHLLTLSGTEVAAAITRASGLATRHLVLAELNHPEAANVVETVATSGVQVIAGMWCREASTLEEDLGDLMGADVAKRFLQAVGLVVHVGRLGGGRRLVRVSRINASLSAKP